MRPILELLEEPWLEVSRSDVARGRHQCPDLASPDEATPAKLDALQSPGPGPAPDRVRPEVNIRRGQDLDGFAQADPVRRRRHGQSADEGDEVGGVAALTGNDSGLALGAPPSPSPTLSDFGEPPSPLDPLAGPDSPGSLESVAFDGRRPPLRSFLAQPEPLKWIVGGLNALLNVPTAPQAGQALGAPALMECTISVFLPQLEQM